MAARCRHPGRERRPPRACAGRDGDAWAVWGDRLVQADGRAAGRVVDPARARGRRGAPRRRRPLDRPRRGVARFADGRLEPPADPAGPRREGPRDRARRRRRAVGGHERRCVAARPAGRRLLAADRPCRSGCPRTSPSARCGSTPEGSLWVGTAGGGLLRVNRLPTRRFGAESGLADVAALAPTAAGGAFVASGCRTCSTWTGREPPGRFRLRGPPEPAPCSPCGISLAPGPGDSVLGALGLAPLQAPAPSASRRSSSRATSRSTRGRSWRTPTARSGWRPGAGTSSSSRRQGRTVRELRAAGAAHVGVARPGRRPVGGGRWRGVPRRRGRGRPVRLRRARAERAGARRAAGAGRHGLDRHLRRRAGPAAGRARRAPHASSRGCPTTRSRGSSTTAGGGCGSRPTAGSPSFGRATWRPWPTAARGRWTPVVLGTERGVAEANFGSPAGFADADGRLWFGTIAGACPSTRRRSPSTPRRRSSASRRSGPTASRYPLGPTVTVPPLTARLRLGFTPSPPLYPERMRFRFRVEGIDADWVDAGAERTVDWSPPGPGRHRFLVEARNEDGIWSSAPAAVVLDVLPAWWQTTAFRAAAAPGRSRSRSPAAVRLRIRAIERRHAERAARPRGAAAGRREGGEPARAARARLARGAGRRARHEPRARGPPADRRHRQQRGGGQAPPRRSTCSAPRSSSRSSATSSPTPCARRRSCRACAGSCGPAGPRPPRSTSRPSSARCSRSSAASSRTTAWRSSSTSRSGLPPVEGLRVQLGQIVVNLVVNACEALAGVEGEPAGRDLDGGAGRSRGARR